jgi:hypothetical protein
VISRCFIAVFCLDSNHYSAENTRDLEAVILLHERLKILQRQQVFDVRWDCDCFALTGFVFQIFVTMVNEDISSVAAFSKRVIWPEQLFMLHSLHAPRRSSLTVCYRSTTCATSSS